MSRIADSAAEVFSSATPSDRMVAPMVFFWKAPSRPRRLETWLIASSKGNNVVDGDLGGAQKIVDDAINQVSSLRGRLGAFQKNTIGATIRSLGVALENTSAAESAIRDTDFASETAALTRSQILVQSSTQILGIANSQPQNALALLG